MGDDIDELLEEGIPFSDVIKTLCNPNQTRDDHSVQIAAVASALVEVIQEKLPSESFEHISPASFYLSALNALNSTLVSDRPEQSSPQLALLEILRQVIPYCASSHPNIYVNQFPTLSRSLRGIIASIPSSHSSQDQSKISTGWNALLRQCMRTSTIALNGIMVHDKDASSSLEKDILKCYQHTILQQFDDPRPKVRRQAHSCALELMHLCHSLQGTEGNIYKLIPDHMVQYCHLVMSSFINKGLTKSSKHEETDSEKKEKIVKLLHLLTFLSSSLTVLNETSRLSLGEDLMKLFTFVINLPNSESQSHIQQNYIMVASNVFTALLQIFDKSESESLQYDTTMASKEDSFCAQAWASFLNGSVKLIACTNGSDDTFSECRILYVKCCVAIASRLVSTSSYGVTEKTIRDGIAPKLLPLTFTSIINCIGDDNISRQTAQSLSVELNRLIKSSAISYFISTKNDTCVDSCSVIMQKLLHYRFCNHWEETLRCLSSFIIHIVHEMIPISGCDEDTMSKMNKRVEPLLGGLVRSHSDVSDKSSKKCIETAIGAVIAGIGIEMFLGIVSLSPDGKDSHDAAVEKGAISNDRVWILAVMKSSVSTQTSQYRPRLAFFQSNILGLARKCDANSAKGNLTAVESSIQQSRVVDLWSLFPSFCENPSDVDTTFPTLALTLVRAMSDTRYPQLLTIICSGLKKLSDCVQMSSKNELLDEENDDGNDLNVLSEASVKLLPALFKLVETLNGTEINGSNESKKEDMDDDEEEDDATKKNLSQESQRIMSVIETIAAYAQLAPPQFLKGLFKKVIQRLLVCSQSSEDESEKICTLLSLSQALVKSNSLNEECISLLYRSVRPFIRSDEHNARVQKRAYKVMADICQHHTQFVTSAERLSEMTELMIGSTTTLQISARYMRLRCMKYIVEGLDSSNKTHMDVIPNIIGEVILCLKDANCKTRECAYQLLLSMAQAKGDITQYFQIIVAALGAQTPHMRSAAVMSLSRLVFEYARTDFTVQSFLPSLLQTVVVLFDENSREVTKSVIGFVRVSVAAMNKEQLYPLLPEVVGGIMKFNKGKGRFRSKIKIILKKLVRHYGYEAITPLIPEGDQRLINHMRKLSERAARRKAENVQDGSNRDGEFSQMMDSDEDDSDDGRTLMTGITGFTKLTAASRKSLKSKGLSKMDATITSRSVGTSKTSKSTGPRIDISGESDGDILDMLDPKATKNVRFTGESDDSDSDDDDDSIAMEFDDHGKLVIHGGPDSVKKQGTGFNDDNDNDDQENDEIYRGAKRMRVSKFENAKLSRDEANVKRSQKKQKTQVVALGAAYKSKKAGGDVKKKNQQYEPYAYVPLDGKSYTKKNRAKAVAQMATVVRDKGGSKRKRR